MKKLLFVLLVLWFGGSEAQISYDNNTNQFTLGSMRPNKQLMPFAAGAAPGSIPSSPPSVAYVLEYGNGYFTTGSNPYYTYNLAGTTQVVISYSGRYDTIKPPKAFAAKIFPTNTAALTSSQSILNAGEFVRLTPIASEINVNDEMLFILTYRLPQQPNVKLAFYYNDPNLNVFQPITNNTAMISESLNDQNVTGSISRIRTYFGEPGSSVTLPSPSINSSPNINYANALSWGFPIAAPYTPGQERNIFITLRTKDNFAKGACGKLEAVYVHDSTTSYSTLDMCVSARPHDPNYISTIPECITKGTGTQTVKYRVHCQNEGGGSAYRLEVDVFMDDKLKQAISQLQPNSFKVDVGNKRNVPFDYRKLNDSTLHFDIPPRDPNNMNHTLLPLADSSLSCNRVPVWFSNQLTMGDIYFSLDVPINEEADLDAYAKITFYDALGNAVAPVSTRPDTLFIRDHCSDSLYPRMSPIPPPCTNCPPLGCRTFLGICWWWWIVIITGLLIILYMVSRRRRRDQSYPGA